MPQMTLKGFEIMKAHMNSSEKVLQTISNFERKKLDTNDGCGLSWLMQKVRATKIAEKVLLSDLFHKFQESDGFIEKVLPLNNLIGVSLHGEGNEMSEEVADALMRPLRDSWVNCVKRIIFLKNENVVDVCAQLLTSLPGNHGTCIFTVFLNTKMQKDDAVIGIWIVNKLQLHKFLLL